MGHRAYTTTGQTDAFGNEKKRPAFPVKAHRASSPRDIGGAAHRAAVREGTPVNTLSIPSALGMTVPYQAATGEEVRKAFGVILHQLPIPAKTPKVNANKGRTRPPARKPNADTPKAADPRIGRDLVKRCTCCGEPESGCFNKM